MAEEVPGGPALGGEGWLRAPGSSRAPDAPLQVTSGVCVWGVAGRGPRTRTPSGRGRSGSGSGRRQNLGHARAPLRPLARPAQDANPGRLHAPPRLSRHCGPACRTSAFSRRPAGAPRAHRAVSGRTLSAGLGFPRRGASRPAGTPRPGWHVPFRSCLCARGRPGSSCTEEPRRVSFLTSSVRVACRPHGASTVSGPLSSLRLTRHAWAQHGTHRSSDDRHAGRAPFQPL